MNLEDYDTSDFKNSRLSKFFFVVSLLVTIYCWVLSTITISQLGIYRDLIYGLV
jgi:hypothetical protein